MTRNAAGPRLKPAVLHLACLMDISLLQALITGIASFTERLHRGGRPVQVVVTEVCSTVPGVARSGSTVRVTSHDLVQ